MSGRGATPTAERMLLGSLTLRREQPVELQQALIRSLLDADRLVRDALEEGVAGLLYVNLKRAAALAPLPRRARRDLEAAYHRTAAMNLRMQRALADLGARLEAAGPEVIVLKGMALLDTLYEDPGTRATGDIDLRVAPEDRRALDTALSAEGFVSERFYPDTYRRGATTIDVHGHVLTTARIKARAGILAQGEPPLLAGRRPTGYGRRIVRLGEPAELLLSSLHLMKHNADRLIWLIEINERIDRLEEPRWQDLVALFDLMGQRRSLDRVAFLANLLLPHTAAPRLRRWAERDAPGMFERRALTRRRTRGALPVWGPLMFFSAPGSKARATAAFETLLPRPRVLRQVFEDAETSAWRLYVRRIGQLFALVVR